jgi:pantoate--beta-alanine ligase
MTPPILRKKSDLRAQVCAWKQAGESVGLVPTMGALHQGHLSLVEQAKQSCDRVIVTIFVNPKQFNNAQDLANYPRTEHEDARKLADQQVDLIYCPDPDQIYPDGFCTNVSLSGLTEVLCGAHRPGHFDGVATVVTKLFTQTLADKAFFGEKDFQQLQVVKRLVSDLDLPIAIHSCPTLRDPDGLAMSSRNLRLSDEARKTAPALYRVLTEMAQGLRDGGTASTLAARARDQLQQAGFGEVEYLDLRACGDLSLLEHATSDCRLLVATWLDGVRLIDNISV